MRNRLRWGQAVSSPPVPPMNRFGRRQALISRRPDVEKRPTQDGHRGAGVLGAVVATQHGRIAPVWRSCEATRPHERQFIRAPLSSQPSEEGRHRGDRHRRLAHDHQDGAGASVHFEFRTAGRSPERASSWFGQPASIELGIPNRVPHGPEPCRCRVLRCPTDSRVVLANTKSTRLVSFGDPLEPSSAGNA